MFFLKKNVNNPKIFLLLDSMAKIAELKKVLEMETFEYKQFLLLWNTMLK